MATSTQKKKAVKVSLRGTFPAKDAAKLKAKLEKLNMNATTAGYRIQFDLKRDSPISKTMIESALNASSMNTSSIKLLQEWIKLK